MATAPNGAVNGGAGLQRSIGFWGLMFVSLGSIIGSGWLLSALTATKAAGPAAILSWILATAMLIVLALVFAELGGAYPVAGGSGRFPFYSHGAFTGFIAAWASWLPAVATVPIEILAAITYVNSVSWVNQHFDMLDRGTGLLNGRGLVVASVLLIAFTAMNLAGAKVMSDSNGLVVLWKTAVPALAIVVVTWLSFHPGNITAGGSFMPFGAHGVFAALPLGVVFALQGFEQAAQLAGEAKKPQDHMARAIITAMLIGALLYIALQVAFVFAVKPADVEGGWSQPLGTSGAGAYGAWYTLALAVGAGWLAVILIIDAVVSPAGTGIVYLATAARLSYAIGQLPELPAKLASTDRRGVPVWSIIISALIGWLCFGPFPSWSKLVQVVTAAAAIMYAFAPIALGALHSRDHDRPRSYRMPVPGALLPTAFISANLLLYWSGYDVTWKLDVALVIGGVLFLVGAAVKHTYTCAMLRHGYWMIPWLVGMTVISHYGNYGVGIHPVFNNFIFGQWSDLVIVAAFALVIYYWARAAAMPTEKVKDAVARDAHQIETGAVLPVSL